MAAKYYCDMCNAELSPVGTAPDGTIEGSGVRSVDPTKGWERCALGLAARHFCVICGFGVADAFNCAAKAQLVSLMASRGWKTGDGSLTFERLVWSLVEQARNAGPADASPKREALLLKEMADWWEIHRYAPSEPHEIVPQWAQRAYEIVHS